ncbi:hypothetical protein R50073_40760 [Maricurvus nonylphenolicus]
MNRQKKREQIFKKKLKKAKAKLQPDHKKPRYISKADRAKAEQENKTEN